MKNYKKSSFPYWFSHWCAFNLVALNLGVWKFRFLFHDIEKPWVLLLTGNYRLTQRWHRKLSAHHHQGKDPDKVDWIGLVVDWECSRYTKPLAQMNARETMVNQFPETAPYISPILDKLGL